MKKNILNITNGDSAVEIMQQAGIEGDFLPWRDVLHDGPVPSGLSLEELSDVRAKFINSCGWGSLEDIKKSFIERDNTLKSLLLNNSDFKQASASQYEKVILWFEHDLYDQLQIIQILDWFNLNLSKDVIENISLSIICVDQYLGMLSAEEMAGLSRYEMLVTNEQLLLSSKAWSAFRADSPETWSALLATDTSALPFLEGAIIRQLEEYPNCNNGLSRTAKQALIIISEGEANPFKVFGKSQAMEDRMYMGDSGFWIILQDLLKSSTPLLELDDGVEWTSPPKQTYKLRLTPAGEAVLSGESNWLQLKELDRWIGGVHLKSINFWCWDSTTQSVIHRVRL